MTLFSRTCVSAALALAVLLPCANAGSIDAIYAFGDSLSDVGNAFALTGIPASPPYFKGQFSNGPVWVQDLAAGLGLAPLTPSVLGGTDYAYGGGETGTSFDTANPISDLLGSSGQVAQFQAANPVVDPNALYTIWIGSNDLSDIPAGSTPAQVSADLGAIATNIGTAVDLLATSGAKNFLLLTVPDLGNTPLAVSEGPAVQAAESALSAGLDTALVNGVIPSLAPLVAADGLSLQVLNTYALLDSVVADPAAFGITDVSDACLMGATPCAMPGQFLFWDDIHPTAAGHTIVGDAALALVTPEPGSLSLIGAGLLALCLVRRRSKA